MKPRRRLLLALLPTALLLVALVLPLNFTQSPSINFGTTVYVTDSLVCRWGISADATAENITWYRNGAPYASTYDNTTLNTSSTLPPYTALKNEAWRCSVTLFNATNNATQETNVTIQNSAPTTPIVTNATGQDIGTAANVIEGQTSTYTLNSTDVDVGETLTYYLKMAGFCTVTDSAAGTVSCTPRHADVRLPNESEVVTQKNITFWVDDSDPIFAKSASITVTFNLTPVNDPPTLTIPTQTTPVNATYNQTFTASDEEHDYPITASVAYNLTDAEIRNNVNVTVEGNNIVRIVYFTSPIDWNDVGNRTVTLNLTDSRNASVIVNFTLEITSVNRPPYFTNFTPDRFNSSQLHAYVLYEGQNIVINVTANDPDTADQPDIITFADNTSMFSIATLNSTATNTSDARGQINYTATNNDVGNQTVLITLQDAGGATTSTTLNFTIINVIVPPVINNQSFNATNTEGNVNITPLVAYLNGPFRYQVNYTDPDLRWGDILTWTDNTTTFNITNGGLIAFTPIGSPRNETVNITMTDSVGFSDSRSIILEIRNNTPPRFNATFPTLACSDDLPCVLNLSDYATDDDPGDYVATYADTFLNGAIGSFSLNATSGLISFIPQMADIGNYTANITIADSHGATASQLLNITVNNTPHPPVWVQYDFSGQTIVQDHTFNYMLQASDEDLLLPNSTEYLSFVTNLSWVTLSVQSVTGDTYHVLLSFTPNASLVGNQSIQLNVTDATNLTNSTIVNFTVLAKTTPPVINFIRPYGDNFNNHALVRGWLTVNGVPPPESVVFPENTSSVVFEVNATDNVTPVDQLLYTWFYDGSVVQPASGMKSYTRSFDFFSDGNHTLSVTVNDTRLESTNWTWTLAIQDVNRPPVLEANFTNTKQNISISTTTTKENYFVYNLASGGFYDPDDDPASNPNSFISSNYTLHLTYATTACNVASLTFQNNSLTLKPLVIGSCNVIFTATDPGNLSAVSNLVSITVTDVPKGQTTVVSSSGGGGGGTATMQTFIPLKQEVEKPKPLNIIAPRLVTIYRNQTVAVPIELRNNWTTPLKSIVLSAKTNATGVQMAFDSNYLAELPLNGTRRVMMTVYGYRLGENFEVEVSANVSDPQFDDTALILFNSIEQSQAGQDVSIKVTFAQDLLNQHQECQELNELLTQANAKLKAGQIQEAGNLVDSVINGCKYLISKTQLQTQRPGTVRTPFFDISDATLTLISYFALGAAIIIAGAVLVYYHYKTKEEYNF
jgi:hypothetical protein